MDAFLLCIMYTSIQRNSYIHMDIISFTACPDHIHLSVSLHKPSLRDDTVRLTSTLSGVSLDEVEYYWWLIHEINSPLYTYSVKTRLYEPYFPLLMYVFGIIICTS